MNNNNNNLTESVDKPTNVPGAFGNSSGVSKQQQQQQPPVQQVQQIQQQNLQKKSTSNQNKQAADHDCTKNDNEGCPYLQKLIKNPRNEIVQQQIEGNTVKMLVVTPKNSQRLVTFDISNQECTVYDLLEQAGVPFNDNTVVSFIKDDVLKINYIVETDICPIIETTESSSYDSTDDNNQIDNNNKLTAISELSYNNEDKKIVIGELTICDNCKLVTKNIKLCLSCNKNIPSINRKLLKYNCTQDELDIIIKIIENDNVKNMIELPGIDSKIEPYMSLTCSSVLIGSYKYYPKHRIIINSAAIILSVPPIKNSKTFFKIYIENQHIVKVKLNKCNITPLIFIYTNTLIGCVTRKILGMNDKNGPFYDPDSDNCKHNVIILCPDELTDDLKFKLKDFFNSNDVYQEIQTKESNHLFIRATGLKVI